MTQRSAAQWLIDHTALSARQVNGVRIAFIVGGVAAVVLGILVLAWPGATLLLVGWAFGLYFSVSGVVRVVAALSGHGSTGGKMLGVVFGVLLVIAGVYVLAVPGFGVVVLATTIGIIWIVEGVSALTTLPAGSLTWLGVLYGIVSIVGGVFVIASPAVAASVFLVLAAVMLIVEGVIQAVSGLAFGRARASAA